MPTHVQLPEPVKFSWIRSLLPPVVLAALLVFALTKSFSWHPDYLEPSHSVPFRWQNGVWQPLPALPGSLEKLRVSARGTLWALYWRHGIGAALARLDGSSWRIFQTAEIGLSGFDLSGGFVLDGEDVWTASEKGVLHWDRRQWKTYPEVTGGSSLAAVRGQVWVLDDAANLSHFDGVRWNVEKFPRTGEDAPELAQTSDGTVWIAAAGLWRRESAAWQPVSQEGRNFKESTFISAAGNSLWLWDDRKLVRIQAGAPLQEFDPATIGLAPREMIYEITEARGCTYFATTSGVLEFDGAAWHHMPLPPGGVTAVLSIGTPEDGPLFAAGKIPNPIAQRWQFLIRSIPLLLSLATLAVPIWIVRRIKRHQLSQHQQLRQAVAHATGAVPEEFVRDERLLVRQSSWWSATVAVAVVVGASAGYWVLRIFWPTAPTWTFLAIALGLHLLVMLWQTVVRREAKPWDPIQPGGPGFDWGPTRRALPASLAVFFLMSAGHLPKWVGDPVLWVLYCLLAFVWGKFIEEKLVTAAMRRGDLQGGFRVIRLFHFYNPDGGAALRLRGQLLLMAGRYVEAETALRRAAASLRSLPGQAFCLEALGDVLMEQGREPEALRSYQASLATTPGFRRAYRGMAELALRGGHDPARALELVEQIVGPSGPSSNPLTLNARSTDDYWALKAWALAQLGRPAEADAAVAEALRKTNPRSPLDLAATWRRLGLAMRALGRESLAASYLKKAIEANPNGRIGTLAKEALGKQRSQVVTAQ